MKDKNLKENIDISSRYSRRLISGKVTATAGAHDPQTLKMVYGLGANRIEVLRALEKQNRFTLIWYIVFLALGLVCLIIEPKSWFNCLDLVVLMVNIDLVSRGKVVGIYIGIVECLMYAFICFTSQLYGEVIKMFLINIPLNIFALISWTKNLRAQKKAKYQEGEEENSVIIKKLPKKHYWWLAVVLVFVYGACAGGLYLLGTNALWFSAGVLALTIYQKILNALCYKENWWFSIGATGISILMWIQVIATSANFAMELAPLVSTMANFVNGFYAYSLWKSMYRKIAVNGGEILAKRKVKINKIIKLRHRYQQLIWDREIDEKKNS